MVLNVNKKEFLVMAKKVATNKLSVYLIKKEYIDHKDILKTDAQKLKNKPLKGIGTFYYGESHNFKPSWINNFFAATLGDDIEIFSASAKGLLLVDIDKKTFKRIFAIAFGYGWQFLKPGVYEERFGLKTALSVIDAGNLRKIDKKNMMTIPKDTSEQLSKAGIAADFGIDIEQDLIRAITGKTLDEKYFGKTITGKDAISVSVKVDITTIKDFLNTAYDKYLSNDYQKDFDWIDHIAEIKDVKLIHELNNILSDNMKNGSFDKTWMAVPDIVEWEHISGFKYSTHKDEELKVDIDIEEYFKSLSDKDKDALDEDFLKNKMVHCFGTQNDEVKYQWNIFSCLYCEVTDAKKDTTCLLSNGKWYEIQPDYAKQVNSDFVTLRKAGSTLCLPKYKHSNEGKYNEDVPKHIKDICCLDRQCILHGGSRSKIEFCDLLSMDKKIIHVKHYGGSSVLSHLFSQGLVSGELFLGDATFRGKLNNILPLGFKIKNINVRPNPSDYEIIYGIISKSAKDLNIPFFSKVSLRAAQKRLETFGYNVSLLKIPHQ
jgi:uncharacterized protein (TIGR04141 family)